MKEIVIPPPRRLVLRIVDRAAEATLLAGIVALTALAIRVQLGA
jgi:hypothetical protein